MPINDVKKGAARLLAAVLRTGCFLLLLLLLPRAAQAQENLLQFVGENRRWTSPSESEPTRLCSRALADISPQIASRKR
jgi:hypothetical protein